MNPDFDPHRSSHQGARNGDYIPGDRTQQAWRQRVRLIQLPAVRALSFGSMLAIAISYVHNQSIGWAILHGLLSWFFVIYAALFY
ncbi:MAG TPA: hypothetical protein VGE57_01570 [Solimonas sp.]